MKLFIGLFYLMRQGYITTKSFDSIKSDTDELLKLLTASIKTAKLNSKR